MTTGATKPRQFRLGEDVLAAIDQLAKHYGGVSRAEAIRLAVRETVSRIRKPGRKGEGK